MQNKSQGVFPFFAIKFLKPLRDRFLLKTNTRLPFFNLLLLQKLSNFTAQLIES